MSEVHLKSTVVVALLLATCAGMQTASAAERHHRRSDAASQRITAPLNPQIRDSNAYMRGDNGPAYSDYSRYENAAGAPPAGR